MNSDVVGHQVHEGDFDVASVGERDAEMVRADEISFGESEQLFENE